MYENVPICDLRGVRSVAEAKAIEHICNVAILILPQDAPAEIRTALEAIPMENIATIVRLNSEDDVNICTINGSAALQDEDIPDKPPLYVVNGCISIRSLSPQKSIQMILNGILILHESLQNKAGVQLLVQNGVKEYADFAVHKTYQMDLTVDADFLKYLNPKTILTAGRDMVIAEDVTPEMLSEKITKLIAGRTIQCPKSLLGLVKSMGVAGAGFGE